MATIANDAAQQLYIALHARLTGDATLQADLGGTSEDPRIYQTFIDFDTALALRTSTWVTFNVLDDRPSQAEQTQSIREMIMAVHIWHRGVGSDKPELIESEVRTLLDGQHESIATSELLVWYFLSSGYSKMYEAQANLWHITSEYRTMVMAQRQ